MTRRRALVALAALLGAPAVAFAPGGQAAEPATSLLRVPAAAGAVVKAAWTGTIAPGANLESTCGLPTEPPDEHQFTLALPAGFSDRFTTTTTVTIRWDDAGNDEILTVTDRDGAALGDSDGGSAEETVALEGLASGAYSALSCAFAAASAQDYTGTVVVQVKAKGAAAAVPPIAPARGLSFSATVPSDPQRDESEPLIETDGDGRIYTCGPTGTSGQAEYAQVSEDGGDQFHLLGEQPRGQLAAGGGGDCALAVAATREAGRTNAPFAYTGLNALVTFSTARSADGGRTLQTSANNVSVPGVDRQWMTFVDADTVLLSYNRLQPRTVVVQRSTNGGLTYGPPLPVSPDPTFPGPMRSFYGTPAASGGRAGVAYYTWTQGTRINLAVSRDKGLTWDNCLITDAGVGPDAGFTSSDHDDAGNVYVSYAQEGLGRDAFLTVLPADRLGGCKSADAEGTPGKQPGFAKPVRVNRGAVETVVFPWVAAGGAPGRVAVAYYGTESVGDPNTSAFKASWDVYVNQSTDFLPGKGMAVSQVKATTHPFHYDSICLEGLGCTITGGDRSLADFFALEYNDEDGRLALVYNQGSKQPDEAEGHVATPAVVVQEGGPSNGGGTLTPRRAVVRTSSTDRTGDAVAPYSALFVPPQGRQRSALDVERVTVTPQVDPATGRAVANGGFTVRMRIVSLAEADLRDALLGTRSNSLVYLFRFVNGFQASGATARYSPLTGFTFRFDDYTTESVGCGSSGEKCIVYPGATEIPGRVVGDEIVLSVPRGLLKGLAGGTGPGQRPTERPAVVGTRFYDATAFALANPAVNPADPGIVTFAVPVDNAPAMDFLLPAARSTSGGRAPAGGPVAGPSPADGTLPATGGAGLPALALAALVAGLVLRRRRSA